MQHLKIFSVAQDGPAVIIMPRGEGSAFRYQDLHLEANSIRGHLSKPGFRYLIVDLSEMDYFGSEFIGALVSLLREARTRGGKACFCAARPEMLQVLKNMSLFKLWPHFETRAEAMAALTAVAS